MRAQWCHRCKATVPMLEDAEHARVLEALQSAESAARTGYEVDEQSADDSAATVLDEGENHFAAVIDVFEQITGSRDCNPHALQYHRLSLYGPPCPTCGKPFRTPAATTCSFCAKS